MDFYKSRNSNSTSSQHSNSNSSFKSHASSNNGASYNLEYCTSSSSLSPFGTRANRSSFTSCPSSSAKTIVNVGLEEVFLSISNSSSSASHISASSASSCSSSALTLSKFSNKMCSSSRHSATVASSSSSASAARVTAFAATSAGSKRKRCTTTSLDDRDPELGFEPAAKRQQCLPTLYPSDNVSVVSSAYPSPIDELLAQELDTHSSSECLSTGTDFELVNDAIPDSPNSLKDDNILIIDENVLKISDEDHNNDEVKVFLYNNDANEVNDRISNDEDDGEDVISSTTSPSSSTYSTTITQIYNPANTQQISSDEIDDSSVHHGECTPRFSYNAVKQNKSNNTSASQMNQPKVQSFDEYLNNYVDCMTPADDPEPSRQCPLPALSWANAQDVWQLMCKQDEQATRLRNSDMLDFHPSIQSRMRAILLDWLIEVCEVYKLNRETYYLAVDYLDRYLSVQKNVQKTHLQLIGITCLFVAAKVEEIYPPKIGEFAYVTDGACQESDILQHEILLLQTLDWNINPITPIGWLGVYMQLNVNNRTPASFQTSQQHFLNKNQNNYTASKKQEQKQQKQKPALNNNNPSVQSKYKDVDDAFIYPQFSGLEFVQTAQLLDLCSLNVNFTYFPYSLLAAAAISHTFDRETAVRCSGIDANSMEFCREWMEPFFEVILEESHNIHLMEQNEQFTTKFGLGHVCPNIVTDDSHSIQTHTTTMAMVDRASLLQDQMMADMLKAKQEASPATGLMCPHGLLTPPASSRKPIGSLEETEDDDNHQNLQNAN